MTKYAQRLARRSFESIDTLPIYNWWKIHQTRDFTFLLLDSRHRVPTWARPALEQLWDRIYSEYIERFGFGESFLRILRKRVEIAELKVEKWTTGDLSVQTLIDISEHDLERLKKEASGETDFYESKARMERQLGFVLDPHRVSVAEFNSYISSLQKASTHVR